ncbi:two-component system sensor histidine kinase DcuS [Paenalkalicoccus suaedae]|uniref:histidine kinase n=1 Tax=Paenalkalicoccus suaedae TaxID=2592382 RepID=A0A859FGM8_9BACI|nr:DcuS/MalK family sensor histidine kinase [Paenalkalicoccus suaedae]QKS72523.1 two-component system sensor histidine kinase DcuS [Paenalkalicoccus suaedae]
MTAPAATTPAPPTVPPKRPRRRISLRAGLILLVVFVVGISLLLTDLLINQFVGDNILAEQERKGQTLAQIVAQEERVIEGLQQGDVDTIQAYAERVRETSGVLFVVVMDMNSTRFSHPTVELIGETFVGGDEGPALRGETYSSQAEGTLTVSLRSFAPIYAPTGEQIGAVSVGDSMEFIEEQLTANHLIILTSSLVGLAVGITGAVLIASYVRRILHGQEPRDIARTFEERNRMLESVREGIIAVDHAGTITLVNEAARTLFTRAGIDAEPVGMKAVDLLPETGLFRVIETGEAELDQEMQLNQLTLLINRVPLVLGNEIVGAISTFRDKTEVNALAEQLTGVKLYSEALRAQSHEMKNKLHVITGMLHNESYEELRDYVSELTKLEQPNGEVGLQAFKDPVLVGFMHGKYSYMREKQVDFHVRCETEIPIPKDRALNHAFITIAGNLIDNAAEAVYNQEVRSVSTLVSHKNRELMIQISDNGPGLSDEVQERLFEKGFSTKGADRGYGMHLVLSTIQALGGTITIDTSRGRGTTMTATIPYEEEDEA